MSHYTLVDMRTHVAKVACPVFCAFWTQAELDAHLEVLGAQNLLGAHFVHIFGLTIHKQGENGRSISGDE